MTAAVVLLAVLSLSAFLDVRDSTIALSSLQSLAPAELSAAHAAYHVERITFEESGSSATFVLHLLPASPMLEDSIRASLEGLSNKVRARTGYHTVKVEVVQ